MAAAGERIGGIEVIVEVGEVHVRRAQVDALRCRTGVAGEGDRRRADHHRAVTGADVGGAAGDRHLRVAEIQAVERTLRNAHGARDLRRVRVAGGVQIRVDFAVGIPQRQVQGASNRRDLRAVQVRGHVERGRPFAVDVRDRSAGGRVRVECKHGRIAQVQRSAVVVGEGVARKTDAVPARAGDDQRDVCVRRIERAVHARVGPHRTGRERNVRPGQGMQIERARGCGQFAAAAERAENGDGATGNAELQRAHVELLSLQRGRCRRGAQRHAGDAGAVEVQVGRLRGRRRAVGEREQRAVDAAARAEISGQRLQLRER